MNSIFSTYSTGENRVTASFLAVLRSLSLDRMQRLLGALLEQSEFELIRFENQPSKGGAGVAESPPSEPPLAPLERLSPRFTHALF